MNTLNMFLGRARYTGKFRAARLMEPPLIITIPTGETETRFAGGNL